MDRRSSVWIDTSLLHIGGQCLPGIKGWRRLVYTTPGSYLQINISDSEQSIECKLNATDTHTESEVEVSLGKHQFITSEVTTMNIQAPQQLGSFYLTLTDHQTRKLIDNDTLLKTDDDVYRMDGSTIDLMFTFNVSLWSKEHELPSVDNYYQFQLRIINASSNDLGNYTCSVNVPIEFRVAPIQFLDQNDDNIIYVQEGNTVGISCASITGYEVEKMSIEENLVILAENNSSLVTFYFKPDRQDYSREFVCKSKPNWLYVRVNVLVNYPPGVKMLLGVNRIDCFPDGFPDTYIFYRWEHQSEIGEHIRFLNGLGNGTLILQTLPQRYQISGIYVCTVSNGIADTNGSKFQRGFTRVNYQGAPIFVPGHRNVKHDEPGKPLLLTFLLYSDPLLDDIWIKSVGTDRNQSEINHEFRISNTTLSYTAFENKGNISGYKITIETNILNSNDISMYKIWAKNKLGVASYIFEIIAVESQKRNDVNTKHNVNQSTRSITISTIATCLFVYIVVSHIYVCVRQRNEQTRRSNISESLLEEMYDEIGTISYQAVNISPLETEQSERVQQFRGIRSLQPESDTVNVNNQLTTDRTFNTSSRLSVQEYQLNALHINNVLGVTSNVSPVIATHDIVHIQRRQHSSNSNRLSTILVSSDELSSGSSGATQVAFDIDEGYENPYQIVIKEEQDSHTYSQLTKQSEQLEDYNSLLAVRKYQEIVDKIFHIRRK
ncbi:uncharacterized protein LOC134691597 [Mytilus trossulus]|uniref:uncharacterized protein LOC134691597 n=1 Tax=Mytilus trossulus TaxID=6551 RepID=UPI0030053E9E